MGTGSLNQPVTGTLPPGPLTRLLAGTDYSLADWYATPLVPLAAGAVLALAERALRSRLCAGASRASLQVLVQICRFWQDGVLEACGTASVTDAREAALRELVQGQLLASRKLARAPAHLARGFRLAAPLLETADYFRLLREHELLACLPYSDRPAPALDLPALLNEAAVIRRLQRGDRRRPVWPHLDTLG
jgi:hypothetical protein